MRVLVSGGRDYDNRLYVGRILNIVEALSWGKLTVIHGAATGADSIADDWANEYGVPVKRFPAYWAALGDKAGPIRNQKMLDEGKPHLVLAFLGGNGTRNMCELANMAGVPVMDLKDERIPAVYEWGDVFKKVREVSGC